MRVLVIEDEPRLAASIARALTDAGFAVDIAHDGHTGLWRAQEMPYDVITLDRMLPDLSGDDVCARLRERGSTTPLLMLTARGDEADELEGFELGADDYVRKPFGPSVLVARVHALARRGGVAPVVVTIGDLSVDLRARRCHRAGREIPLTAREFDVLSALVARTPNVVVKAELLDLVWGFEFDGDPAILEVYISYLRKKIDLYGESPLIHTVRRVGYRIAA